MTILCVKFGFGRSLYSGTLQLTFMGLRLVSRGRALGDEREIVRLLDQNAAFSRKSIRIAVRIYRDTTQAFGCQQLREAGRQPSGSFAKAGHCRLKISDVLVHLQCAKVVE